MNRNYGVPRDRRVNDWRSVERAIREHISYDNGNYVRWFVGLYYDDDVTGRPQSIVYLAELYNINDERFVVLYGVMENRDLA